MTDNTVLFRLEVDNSGAVSGFRVSKNELEKLRQAAEGAGDSGKKGADGMRRLGDETARTGRESQQTSAIMRKLNGIIAGVFTVATVRQAVRYADTMTQLGSRLRVVTDSTEEFNTAQEETLEIANRTRSSLESTVELYARLELALEGQNVAQQDILRVTETLNQAYLVGGATAAEAASSVIQLSQGLAAGALRGDEFRSVMEQAPRVVQALSQALGITRGELREMANDGELTTEIVVEALLEQSTVIQEEYDQVAVTVEQAFTVMRNNVLQAVGDFDQATGASAALADTVLVLSENLDTVANVGIAAVSAGLVAMVPRFAAASRAAIAFTASLGPIGLIAAGVGVATVAYLQYAEAASGAALSTREFTTSLSELETARGLTTLIDGIRADIDELNAERDALTERFTYVEDAESLSLLEMLGFNVDKYDEEKAEIVAALNEVNALLDSRIASLETARDRLAAVRTEEDAESESLQEKIARLREEAEAQRAAQEAAKAREDALKSYNDLLREHGTLTEQLAVIDADYEAALQGLREALSGNAEDLARVARAEEILRAQRDAARAEAVQDADAVYQLRDAFSELGIEIIDLNEQGFLQAEILLEELTNELGAANPMVLAYAEAIRAARLEAEGMEDTDPLENLRRIERIAAPGIAALRDFKEEMENLQELRDEGIIDDEMFDRLAEGLERAILGARTLGEEFQHAGYAFAAGFSDLASVVDDGSQAFRYLQVAIDASNVIAAVGAVLNQGQGDPYTAFARMAAMAAAVASLGYSVGNISGGVEDPTARRQESQGAGTVLGDAEAKSESIARATEITADATSELVGINRGMLRALQSLESGIAGASSFLARGAGEFEVDLSNFGTNSFGSFLQDVFDPLGGPLADLLGGSADLVDSGLIIRPGTIEQLIANPLIEAYQEIAEKKHIFDDTDIKLLTEQLDQGVASQFSLIFQSIALTIEEAAAALGLNVDEIRERIAGFRIEEIMISLEGLTAEEQAAELAAVFSGIFDDLALAVIPFIADFQQIGEGLGETLVRVATSVQVFQEAVIQLGFAADITDPQQLAEVAVGLIELTGGIDEFIAGMTTFVDRFASEEHKFNIASDAINRAFEQIGLEVPATRDALFDLVQGLDITTEAGREQLATILGLTDALDTYYDLLEDVEAERLAAIEREHQALEDLVESFEQAAISVDDILNTTIRNLYQETLSPEELHNDLRSEALSLADSLATAGSREEVLDIVGQIDAIVRQNRGAAGDTRFNTEFIEFLEQVGSAADIRLDELRADAIAEQELRIAEVEGRESFVSATDTFADAVQTFEDIVANGDIVVGGNGTGIQAAVVDGIREGLEPEAMRETLDNLAAALSQFVAFQQYYAENPPVIEIQQSAPNDVGLT